MTYRFRASTDGGSTYTTLTPGVPDSLFQWSKDDQNGRAPKRMEFGGALTFFGDDYLFFKDREENGDPCENVLIEVDLKCAGSWELAWSGYIPNRGGEWDMHLCTMTVKPEPMDRYTCFQDAMKIKHNMIDVAATGCEAFFDIAIPFVRPYPEARLLYDVIVFLLDESGCEYTELQSDFFEWNPPGDAPGYSSGINYVTGATNKLNLLYIDQKSNTLNTSQPSQYATKAELSLGDMLKWLREMFCVYWDIDTDGIVRLEHIKFWEYGPGLSLYDLDSYEPLRYKFLRQQIPRRETFEWMDESIGSGATDFLGLDIIYPADCAGTELQNEKSISLPITTDLLHLASNEETASPRGFVLIATAPNGASPDLAIWTDNGALSGTPLTNVPLSWANLHRDYWTWDRYLPTGNLNGADVTFDGFRPTTEQAEVLVKCFECDTLTFDSNLTMTSRLGTSFGDLEARVKQARLGTDGHLRLILDYSK